MMKWLRRKIFSWLADTGGTGLAYMHNVAIDNSASAAPETPHTRVGVLPVMNGKLIEVCSFKRNPNGPDWSTTYWIMNPEKPLAEEIALVLTMKGLEK